MPERKKEERDMRKVCEDAIGHCISLYVWRNIGAQPEAILRAQKRLATSLHELFRKSYTEGKVSEVIEVLIRNLRMDLIRIIQEESDLSADEKRVQEIINQIRPYQEQVIAANKQNKLIDKPTAMRLRDLLRMVENLIKKEVNITKSMEFLEKRLRQIIKALQRED